MGKLASVIGGLLRRGTRGRTTLTRLRQRVLTNRSGPSTLHRRIRRLRRRLSTVRSGLSSGRRGLSRTSHGLSTLHRRVATVGRHARRLQRRTRECSSAVQRNTSAILEGTLLRGVIDRFSRHITQLSGRNGSIFSNSLLRTFTRGKARIVCYTALLFLNCISSTAAFTRNRNNNNDSSSLG